MHARIPQLGYYHTGMGTYVYHDEPQMGDFFSDLTNSLNKGLTSIENQITSLPGQLVQKGQDAATSAFLNTPAGQAAEQRGIQAGIQDYINKTKTFVKTNPTTSLVAVAGIAFLAYAILKPAARAAKETVVQFIPMPGIPAAPAAAAATAAKNPKRRRRHKRHARRGRK